MLFISDTLHHAPMTQAHQAHSQCHAAPSAARSDLRRKAAQSFVRSKLLQLQITHLCSSSATHYSMQHQVQQQVISEGRQHKVSSEANCFSCKLPICALHQRHITPCSNDPSTPSTFTLASLHDAMQQQGQQQATSHCCFTITPMTEWGERLLKKGSTMITGSTTWLTR